MQLSVKKPCTVYIKFSGAIPGRFELRKPSGSLYFFRKTNGNMPRIKFNMPRAGNFISNVPFEIVKIVTPIEIPTNFPTLPKFERNRVRDVDFQDNPTLTGTPARIFTQLGIIEKGQNFYTFPEPIRVFILLHEIGHFYYKTEEYCDMFALEHFLKMGYNKSTAYYCLEEILNESEGNIKRLKELYKNILKTTA
jgi:hypothetical protein